MNPIALSDLATHADKRLCLRVASELGLSGVELTPLRLFNDSVVDGGTLSFHGSPFAGRRSMFDRIKYGAQNERALIMLWYFGIGPLFSNPALSLAKKLGIPLVLHQENILELAEEGSLERLRGAKIAIENTNFRNHPLVGGRLQGSFFRSIELAKEALLDVSLVIDLEHYAMSRWPGTMDLAGFCERASQLAPITEFHVCDSAPGKPFKIHMVAGRGEMSLYQQLEMIGFSYPDALVVIEHAPAIGKLAFLLSDPQKRFDAVIGEIEESASFIKEALDPI